MRVVHVIRHKNPRFFSIENVFNNLRESWPDKDVPEVLMLPRTGFSLVNIFTLLKFRIKHSACIYHVTGDVHYAALCLPRKKTLLTIHDCVFINRYKGLKGWLIRLIYLDLPIWHLKFVTTVSEKTKQEITGLTGCNPAKITVVNNPVSSKLKPILKLFNKDNPSLLFIGTTSNKNLERVCVALKDVPSTLNIIGTPDDEQKKSIAASGIHWFAKSGLSDQEMSDMYSKADIVLYPSLYEGFGLPVLEGFASGRIVVTSNISPLKEIAEDAAILVDPNSVDSIKAGVLNAINNKDLREHLVVKGLEKVRKYAASRIALEYLQIYKTIDAG